jgi:hypothetical protein
MEAKIVDWEEFQKIVPDAESEFAPDNGSGKEWASYLVIRHEGKIFEWHSDAMEREDTSFNRDLSWIVDLVARVYQQGLDDADTGEPE